MNNIWNIYGMGGLAIVLYSIVGKPRRNTLRNLWISYAILGFILGLGIFKINDINNKEDEK
jgi:hypothetical protein